MWIRSQDKETLIDVNCFSLQGTIWRDGREPTYEIIARDVNENYEIIGTYSTKEKVLKVMDMIQKFKDEEPKFIEGEAIGANAILAYINYNYRRTFQMPIDDEVK